MNRPATVMIFAAGHGTRMRHLTADRPKPMIEVAGRMLIDRALDMAVSAGLARVVVNTHYRADMLERHLARERRVELLVSREAEVLLETGGGLKRAAPLLGPAPVYTLNADAVWRGPDPFAALPPPPPGGARLLLVPKDRASGHRGAGDFFLGPDGTLARRGKADAAPFVYTGLQLIDPAAVSAVPGEVFSLNTVWDGMLAAGRLTGAVYPGHWCDVGQPESLALAEEMLRGDA